MPHANLAILDPIFTTATVTSNHGYMVFDTLYGADMELRPQPQMVERHAVSADGLRWDFTLRDGLRFHDDTPVRPADCVASLVRWSQRDVYGQLLRAAVSDWEIPNERTFTMRLSRPFPTLLNALAKVDNPAFIMPARLARTDASRQVTEMVGSGPYRFVAGEYLSGSKAVYERFEGYHPRPERASRNAGGKVAHFGRVEWLMLPDPATAASALMQGEIDWWERPLPDLRPMLARHPQVRSETFDQSGYMYIMRLNCLQPPFDNPRVRQAVRLAVNQEEYLRASQGNDSSAWKVCRSLWGTGTPFYDGEHRDLMPADLGAAQAALRASGYANEKVVVLNPTDLGASSALGHVTADLLRRLGMNVELAEMDWGTVVQRRSNRRRVEEGGWSIFHTAPGVIGWSNPAEAPMLRGRGENGWFGWWKSDRAEELTLNWLHASSPEQARDFAAALGRLALEEAATIPLGIFTSPSALRRDLTGMLPGSAPYFWGIRHA